MGELYTSRRSVGVRAVKRNHTNSEVRGSSTGQVAGDCVHRPQQSLYSGDLPAEKVAISGISELARSDGLSPSSSHSTTKAQRQRRERELQMWEHSVQQIRRVPENCQWVYVGDSGSDVFTFWQRCEELGYDFVLRVAQDRVIEIPRFLSRGVSAHICNVASKH